MVRTATLALAASAALLAGPALAADPITGKWVTE